MESCLASITSAESFCAKRLLGRLSSAGPVRKLRTRHCSSRWRQSGPCADTLHPALRPRYRLSAPSLLTRSACAALPGPLGKGADSRGTSCHLSLLWWQSTAPRLSPILLVPVTLGGTWGRRASNNRRSCSYLIFSPHSSRKSLPISLTALVTAAFCFSTFTKRAHSFLHLPFQLSFHFPSLFKSLPRVSARPTDSHPGLPTAGETRWCRQASPLNSVSPSLLHSVAPVSAQFMPLGSVFHEQSLFSLWTQFGIWCLVSQVLI